MNDDTVMLAIPRSALTVVEQARTASQKTSERVFGLPRRIFLGLVREFRRAGGTVLEIGKLRVVDVDAFAKWLERRAAAEVLAPETVLPSQTDDPVSSLARELGVQLEGEPSTSKRSMRRSKRSGPRACANKPEAVTHEEEAS